MTKTPAPLKSVASDGFDDIVSLHQKAIRMNEKAAAQLPSDIIKLQMDTLDALVRILTKVRPYL